MKYVIVICKNCGKIQCYTETNYKGKDTCGCGNGRTIIRRKDIITALKIDFNIIGIDEFTKRNYFTYYEDLFKKDVDKGFDIVKVGE